MDSSNIEIDEAGIDLETLVREVCTQEEIDILLPFFGFVEGWDFQKVTEEKGVSFQMIYQRKDKGLKKLRLWLLEHKPHKIEGIEGDVNF